MPANIINFFIDLSYNLFPIYRYLFAEAIPLYVKIFTIKEVKTPFFGCKVSKKISTSQTITYKSAQNIWQNEKEYVLLHQILYKTHKDEKVFSYCRHRTY